MTEAKHRITRPADRLIGVDPRPDPDIWGDLVGELVADPEESPDDEDLLDPFANLPDDDDEEGEGLRV